MSRWGTPHQIRWSPVDGPELRCRVCGEWWSIGPDAMTYWRRGRFSECIACLRERQRVAEAMRALDPEYRRKRAERTRRYKAEFRRAYPDLATAYAREMKRRERERARQRKAAA